MEALVTWVLHCLMKNIIKPPKNQKAPDCSEALILLSRDDWTRTSDPLHPMQVRYRAAPHPDVFIGKPMKSRCWVCMETGHPREGWQKYGFVFIF